MTLNHTPQSRGEEQFYALGHADGYRAGVASQQAEINQLHESLDARLKLFARYAAVADAARRHCDSDRKDYADIQELRAAVAALEST